MLRGRATVTLAYPTFERHGLAPALALLDEAEQVAPGAAGAPVRALASVQRAGFLGRSGDWAAAVRILLAADRDAESLSPRERCSLLLNRGLARMYLHELRESRRDLEASHALALEHGHGDLAFKAQHNLGCLEFLRGDLPTALRLMGAADEMDVDVSRATAKLDFARVLLEAGLLDRAATLLDEASAIARERELWQEVGEILLDQARHAIISADHRTARTKAAAARRTFAGRASTGWRVQAEMLRLDAEAALGRHSARVARAAAVLAQSPMPSPALAHRAAVLAAESALNTGDVAAAAAWLHSVRRPRHLTFSERLHRDLVQARLDVSTGRAGTGQRRLRDVSNRLAEEQGRHASLDTRTALALHGQGLGDLDLDLALATPTPARVFAASERWRAASQRVPPVRPPEDDELAELSSRLRQARAEARDDPSGRPSAALTAELARLEQAVARRGWELSHAASPRAGAEASTGRDDTTARSDRTARGDHADRPVTLSAFAEAARDAATDAVSLVSHRGQLYAVTVAGSRSSLVELGSVGTVTALAQRVAADLGALGRPLPDALRPIVERSAARTFKALDEVLAPALPEHHDRLLVLPSRLLASLPWRRLPSLAGRPVVVAPSATTWVRLSHQESQRAARRGDVGGTGPRTRVTAVTGPGLARAEAEAAACAASWPTGDAHVVPGAVGADLVEALRTRDVVHVAAHGTHHEQSPLFSSVTLADGPVFAYELTAGNGSVASHVVLSACEVGRAVVRPGEEAIGLTASLLAAGVGSVVAALGPVDDAAAEVAMAAYHRELASGSDASLALERATEVTPEAAMFCTFGSTWTAG